MERIVTRRGGGAGGGDELIRFGSMEERKGFGGECFSFLVLLPSLLIEAELCD